MTNNLLKVCYIKDMTSLSTLNTDSVCPLGKARRDSALFKVCCRATAQYIVSCIFHGQLNIYIK